MEDKKGFVLCDKDALEGGTIARLEQMGWVVLEKAPGRNVEIFPFIKYDGEDDE